MAVRTKRDRVLHCIVTTARKPLDVVSLEAEAVRRASEGTLKPTGWHKGEPSGYIREYSDILLIFLLKGAKPEKYAERVQIRGALANIDVTKLPDEAVLRISQGEHPMAVLASMQATPPDHREVTAEDLGPVED